MRRAQVKAGYEPVVTPHIGSKQLYVTSGHYEKYGKDSFQPIKTPDENEEFFLKPMNCPHHCEIYKTKPGHTRIFPFATQNLERSIAMNKVENFMVLRVCAGLLRTMRIFSVHPIR